MATLEPKPVELENGHSALGGGLDLAAAVLSSPAIQSRQIGALLKAYAANPPFRSAEGDEVVIGDNPFRRPVRCEDLRFITFDRPLGRDNMVELSGLAAHRLLINIYEADLVFDAGWRTPAGRQDRANFYADTARLHGEAVRPFLENHAFLFIDVAARTEADDAGRDAVGYMAAEAARLAATTDPVLERFAVCDHRRRIAEFVIVQRMGAGRSRPYCVQRCRLGGEAILAAAGRLLAPLVREGDGNGATSGDQTHMLRLTETCGLQTHAHAYWQFYLSSSLAVTNYLHAQARDPARIFRAVGALLYEALRRRVRDPAWAVALQAAIAEPLDVAYLVDDGVAAPLDFAVACRKLVAFVEPAYGHDAVADIVHGFTALKTLYDIADKDLIAQLTWADDPGRFADLAQRIETTIETRKLNIDRETFYESCDERSTTHVHDTDRLLVIESGEMDFWNSYGPPIRFRPGDMIFVPKYRLHGSVVVSDACVYHQPIVTPELLAAVESDPGLVQARVRAG